MWQVTGRKKIAHRGVWIHSAKRGVDLSEPDLYLSCGHNHGLFHTLCKAQGTQTMQPQVLVKCSEVSDCSSGNSQVVCTCRPCCLYQSSVM